MFTTSHYGRHLEEVLYNNPQAQFLTCYVSRLNYNGAGIWQILPKCYCAKVGVNKEQVQNSDDIGFHRIVGEKLWKTNGPKILPLKLSEIKYKYMSGTLILLKKSLWKKIGGFKESYSQKVDIENFAGPGGTKKALLSIDNQLHRDVLLADEKLYLMTGMYIYHWYRGLKPDFVKTIGPNGGVKLFSKSQDHKQLEMNRFYNKTKKVVYTAVVGDYDTLKDWRNWEGGINKQDNWDYVCFTDNPDLKSELWDIRQIPKEEIIEDDSHFEGDRTKTARKYKLLPHRLFPEHDVSIWLDASFDLRKVSDFQQQIGNINTIANFIFEKGLGKKISEDDDRWIKAFQFVLMSHPHRNTITEELERCVLSKKDNLQVMQDQVRKYYDELEYQDNTLTNRLCETGFLYRWHNKEHVKSFNELWWQEVLAGSKRDQLSFNFVAQKTNLTFKTLPRDFIELFFDIKKHNKNSRASHEKEKLGVEELG